MFNFKCFVNQRNLIKFENETLNTLKISVVVILILCIFNCDGHVKSKVSQRKRNSVGDKRLQFIESNLDFKQVNVQDTNSKYINQKLPDNTNSQTTDQLAKTRTLYGFPRDYTYFLEDYESFGDELIDNRVRRNPKNNQEYSKQKEDNSYEEIAYDEDDDDYADEDSDCTTKPACTTTECTTTTECITTTECTTTPQCTCSTTPECTTTECITRHNKKNKKPSGIKNRSKNKNLFKWAEWSDWTPCSTSCGEGHTTRWRGCTGINCAEGEKEAQFKPCSNSECE